MVYRYGDLFPRIPSSCRINEYYRIWDYRPCDQLNIAELPSENAPQGVARFLYGVNEAPGLRKVPVAQ
jgi:hypothetical protein